MRLLFFAYANPPSAPLPTLEEENDRVYSLLMRRAMQQHFNIHRDASATVNKIAEYLLLAKDYLTIFSYSGHAGQDSLLLSNEERANADGIADLLGICHNLKVVILNGCSTAGQVNKLLEAGVPIVIATSAPVEDRSATQFAISFFQILAEHHGTVEAAFQAGLAAAQTVASTTLETQESRGLDLRPTEQPLWGIFYKEAQKSALYWKLPSFPMQMQGTDYEPNENLIESLVEALAPFNEPVNQINQKQEMGLEVNILDKREAVLKCLPYPISEQLRKLLVPEAVGSNEVFYDKPGMARLRQLARTYNTTVELMAFIMLAQLWDAFGNNKPLEISAHWQATLRQFFNLEYHDRESYDFFPLIRDIRQIFDHNDINYFVTELEELKKIFNDKSDFYNACQFMEAIKRQLVKPSADQFEIHHLCLLAEEKLAVIFSNLGFIANYTLASVKEINMLKYRHFKIPQYKHNLVKLVQRFVGLAEEEQVLQDFMDNASVLMLKSGMHEPTFLNLSPFVIDQNAFDEKAPIAKLYFFDRYERGMDAYSFKHVYKPDDMPLVIHKQRSYLIIKAQFNAFSQLIFNQPMKGVK